MKACKFSTYLMGSKGISNRISLPLLLLICALALAACDGGNPNVGLISQCSSNPTSSTPAGSYNVNNPLPIKEYSTTTCNFRLPRNAAIINATSSNLTLRISVGGEESIFPANNSITLTNGSDATATEIPLEGVGGALITNINLTLTPMDNEFGEVLLNFTTFHRQNNTVLGTLMYRIKVVEVPELLEFTQDSYNFGPLLTPANTGDILGTVNAENNVNPDNLNLINYAFANNTPADTIANLTIHGITGAISPRQDITVAANYTFMVTASQQGAINISSGPVSIEFLSQNASNTLGSVSQCSSNPTSSTPPVGIYNVENPLPIKEYSTTKCNFRLPRNAAIIDTPPNNLKVSITIGGRVSIFPADRITQDDGSDAIASNPAISLAAGAGTEVALITNINLTLTPIDNEFGEVLLNFTTYDEENDIVLGELIYTINVTEVPELLEFTQVSYDFGSFPTPAVAGTTLGTVSATNIINPGNSNQINYAFATGTPADTNGTLAIDIRTGDITLREDITVGANYTFMVTASQQGAMDSNSGPVSIEFLSQDASNTLGLISQCSSNPTSSTPPVGIYNVENPLPIKEYSVTKCNFRLPRNAAITDTPPNNLKVSITIGGRVSIFPADRITLDNGSDAIASNPAISLAAGAGTEVALITNINLTLTPIDNEFGEVLLNFTTYDEENDIVLGTLIYPINVVEVPELLEFNQTQYDFGPFPTPTMAGTTLGTVNATNIINPGNSNQINYTFATDTPAVTTAALAIDIRTGAITPRQHIIVGANYTFMVTASQQGAINISSGPVSIEFLSQDASNTLGLISQCSSNPTSSTPPGSYNINNALPIDEDSSTECDFQLPRNASIIFVPLSNLDNLVVNITIGGMLSIFPAGSITRTVNSAMADATVAPNPLADADGMLITNINLTLAPMVDTFGDAMLIFTTYNSLTNQVLGTLSYPINVMPVDDAPNFPDAPYSFTTIAVGFKGKVLGRVEATIPVDNPNQEAAPSYAFAADNGAADDNFTIDTSTGDIALGRSLVPEDVGDYVFNVIAEQAGTAGEGRAEVTIRILNITGDEDGDGFTNAYDAVPHNAAVNVSGTGTPTDPYIISNIYQLQAIDGVDHTQTHLSDNGSATGGNWLYSPDCTGADDQLCRTDQLASSYQLSNDIDAAVTRGWNNGDGTAAGFYPIGYGDNPFTGSLNGAGFAVHNLFINRTEDGNAKRAIGLFAFASGAQIMNFGLENVNITVTVTEARAVEIGGLIGAIESSVAINLNHVYVTGVIQVMDKSSFLTYAGGLIGAIRGNINITNSYTIVNLMGAEHQGGFAGELTLRNIIIINSYSLNRMLTEGGTRTIGGLLGNNPPGSSITSSYAVSNVKDSDDILSLVDYSDVVISGNASYWLNGTSGSLLLRTAGYKDAKGLSRMQLQNCGLDGFPFDGAADEVCEGLFPSGTATDPLWRDRIEDGVTTYWDFAHANEYPYLLATDGEGRNLLPTVAEQRCQHNLFFYDRPCDVGPADM